MSWDRVFLPPRSSFVTNVVQSQVVQYQSIPIIIMQFFWDMPGHVVVHFGKVLVTYTQLIFYF